MTARPASAGFIGLGAMGAPMAGHLAEAGYLRGVWNRTADAAAQTAGRLGVMQAASPAELAAAVDVVFSCVSADDDLEAVVDAARPGLRNGQWWVDTSTVSPVTAKRLAEELGRLGVGAVDAPVSGGVEGARRGTLSVMAGGEDRHIEAVRPMLEAFATRVTVMGPPGAGQATKAVNQVLVAGIAEGVCEGLALAEQLNLPAERLLEVLTAGAAGSWFLEHRGASMLERRFDVGFKLALLLKDLDIVAKLARELDVPLPVVEAARADYARLVEAGYGDDDISALIRTKSEAMRTGSKP